MYAPFFIAATIAATPAIALAEEASVTTTASADDPGAPAATATVISLQPGAAPGADLAEVLSEAPGVHTRRTSYGQTSFATVRGGSARQLWVELEGLKLNPPFGPGYDLSTSSLLGLDEVVVWRGAAATFRGSGALTGALQFRTRHPRQDGAGARVYALLGSHSTSEVRAEAGVAKSGLSLRLGAAHRASGGNFDFIDEQGVAHERSNNDHERVGLFASAQKASGPTTVRATALYDGGERGAPGQSEFQQQFRFARLTDRQVLGLVRVDRLDFLPGLDTHAVAGHQIRTLRYANPQPLFRGAPILEQAESASSEVSTGTTVWLDRSTGMFELDLTRQSWRDDRLDARRHHAGLGASWEQRFAEQRLGLWAGARAEVSDDTAPAALPGLGVWWQAHPDLRLRANGGRTYRAPDFDELYLDAEAVRGNAELAPESAWTADLGLEWKTEETDASLVAFGRTVEDEILFLPVSAYLVEATNIEGATAVGLEARVGASVASRLFADLSYSVTEARFRQTRVPVPLQPVHQGFARVAVELARLPAPVLRRTRALRAVLEVQTRSEIWLDAFANQRAPGAAFLDAGLTGGRELVWSLFVRNIFDQKSAIDSLQQPIPGRTVWASIKLGALP